MAAFPKNYDDPRISALAQERAGLIDKAIMLGASPEDLRTLGVDVGEVRTAPEEPKVRRLSDRQTPLGALLRFAQSDVAQPPNTEMAGILNLGDNIDSLPSPPPYDAAANRERTAGLIAKNNIAKQQANEKAAADREGRVQNIIPAFDSSSKGSDSAYLPTWMSNPLLSVQASVGPAQQEKAQREKQRLIEARNAGNLDPKVAADLIAQQDTILESVAKAQAEYDAVEQSKSQAKVDRLRDAGLTAEADALAKQQKLTPQAPATNPLVPAPVVQGEPSSEVIDGFTGVPVEVSTPLAPMTEAERKEFRETEAGQRIYKDNWFDAVSKRVDLMAMGAAMLAGSGSGQSTAANLGQALQAGMAAKQGQMAAAQDAEYKDKVLATQLLAAQARAAKGIEPNKQFKVKIDRGADILESLGVDPDESEELMRQIYTVRPGIMEDNVSPQARYEVFNRAIKAGTDWWDVGKKNPNSDQVVDYLKGPITSIQNKGV